jgi:hypothetical protein
MTCIVGLVVGDRVVIGGDSAAGTHGWGIQARVDSKVGNVGEFVFGFTDSFRMGQVLLYRFTPPPIEGELMAYMVGPFIDELRRTFRTAGYAERQNERESGGTFLVGVRGRLFRISSDYQVGESKDSYDAVGCGADIALGSMYSSGLAIEQAPKARILEALSAAEHFSGGVRRPFNIVVTPLASLPDPL